MLVTVAVGGTLIVGVLFVRAEAESTAAGRSRSSALALRVAPARGTHGARRPAESGKPGCAVEARCRSADLGGTSVEPLNRGSLRPSTMCRSRPTFPDPPSDRDIDLVILGESSAEGVPYSNWLSLGSILTWKMSQAIPDRPIRPRVIARSGDTLEWQHRELTNLPRRPDLLIIYCGHNEFTSRLAGFARPRLLLRRMAADRTGTCSWTRSSDPHPVCGLIRETAEKCRIAIPPPPSGHRKLVDVPFYSSTEYTRSLRDFRRRLDAIVSYAERVGALPVLISPAANDAGFEPSRSFLPAATTRNERESFQREFTAARRLETEGQTPMRRSIAIARCSRDTLALPRRITASPGCSSKRSVGRGLSSLRRGQGSRRLSDALSVRLPGGLPRNRIATRLHSY